MPNWSTNTIAVFGKKENVINFINDALTALGKSQVNDVVEGADALRSLDIVTMGTWRPMPEVFTQFDTTNQKDEDLLERIAKKEWANITLEALPDYARIAVENAMKRKKLTLATNRKLRDAQDRYNKEWDEARKTQKEKYGVVGWFDYNCDVRFGTKWDADLDGFEVIQGKNAEGITFNCMTAWSRPDLWCKYISEKYGVHVVIWATEESGNYLGYGVLTEEGDLDWHDYDAEEDKVALPEYEDNEEEYYEAWSMREDDSYSKFVDAYSEMVNALP